MSHSEASGARWSFWRSLTYVEQEDLTAVATLRTFASGATLMQEGESGDHVVVILSGLCRIRVGPNVIAIRGPGDLIGERAALQISVRSATVITSGLVRALVVRTPDFSAWISRHPHGKHSRQAACFRYS